MNDLNPRQRMFVNAITKEMKPKSVAYAEIYGGDSSDPNVQSMASRLSSNVKVKKSLEQIQQEMALEGAEAFQRNIELAMDSKTPANVKNDINKHIMGMAGMNPTQKVESKNETTFKGLEAKDKEELLAKLGYEKKE